MITLFFAALLIGLLLDLYMPIKNDFRKFDPVSLGQLDARMWRSYYEKKPLVLFFQLSKLMRTQFHAPVVRSFVMAFYSAKAAFVFKKGANRDEYDKALPGLNKYFRCINDLSNTAFDYTTMSKDELEWWIIRRERDQHPPSEWSAILCKEAGLMYNIAAEKFKPHADLRVDAMLLRDKIGDAMTEADWKKIEDMCIESWKLFHEVVN